MSYLVLPSKRRTFQLLKLNHLKNYEEGKREGMGRQKKLTIKRLTRHESMPPFLRSPAQILMSEMSRVSLKADWHWSKGTIGRNTFCRNRWADGCVSAHRQVVVMMRMKMRMKMLVLVMVIVMTLMMTMMVVVVTMVMVMTFAATTTTTTTKD